MVLYLVIQIGAFLSRVIPRSWRYLIGTAVGDLVYLSWASKRKILRENMAIVLGLSPRDPLVQRIALKSMRNYCKYLIEFLELPSMSSSHEAVASMRIDGLEHLQRAIQNGKGIVVCSGHFGTIETGGLRLADFADVHAVYDAFRPPYLDRLIQEKRREKGLKLVPATNVREMVRVLRSGGLLTVLFDRPLEFSKGVRVRFFGRETAVPGGPAVLAMKTGATLLPIYMFREPDKSYASLILPPVEWTASGDRDRDVQTIMQKLVDTLQTVVRSRPDQWYMFRPMWPQGVQSAPAEASGAASSRSPV